MPLYIVGGGGFGREVAFLVEEIGRPAGALRWEIRGFLDERWAQIGPRVGKYPVLGDLSVALREAGPVAVAIGIGWPDGRSAVYSALASSSHVELPVLVHPSVVRDPDTVGLGRGTLVAAGCVLTTNIQVGTCVVLNLSCTIGHDVTIGDYCVLNPGVALSGGVVVEEGCLLGAGATVLQNLRIGAGSIVGAGAVVTRDVPSGVTVVGVPAVSMVRDTVTDTAIDEDLA